jgi:Protein of unknown function (DUF3617)
MRPSTFVSPLVLVLACSAGTAWCAESGSTPAKEPGDLWEVTTQMTMTGMPMAMPSQTQKVCKPRNWDSPPIDSDKQHDCQTTDFKTSGSKVTWKMTCTGENPMTGEGEITRNGTDAYAGAMTMHMAEGDMTMKYTGRRIGDCDGGAMKRQIAAVREQSARSQKQVDDMMKAQCEASTESLSVVMLTTKGSPCADPAYKASLCRTFETEKGFDLALSRGDTPGTGNAKEVAAYCGKDVSAVQKDLCVEADNNESLDFLGKHCPVQAQAIAQRECAGRKYTALTGSKYQAFCTQYARQNMD